MVGFRFSRRDPRSGWPTAAASLRLDVLTMTRSAYVQVRCAVVANVERAVLTLHPSSGVWEANLTRSHRVCRP